MPSASSISRFRACCATHAPTGWDVTPSTWTRREATSITNSTYSRLRNTVSTVKKSTANTPLACARRNCRHVIADRVGAGSTPARCRMVHTVLARSCRRGGTARRGCGGSPRSGSPWPAAAPEHGFLTRYSADHAGVGSSSGAAPGLGASAAAWPAGRTGHTRPSVAAAARARPAPRGRPSRPQAWLPAAAAPRPRGGAGAAQRPSRPNSAPVAQATPSVGRTSDTAVAGSCADHRGPMTPGRTRSSTGTTEFSGTHTVTSA
jgi:hypothetical protein